MTARKRTARLLVVAATVLGLTACAVNARASDRRHLPRNAAIGVADVVVVAVVDRVPEFAVRRANETVDIRVVDVLKGDTPGDRITAQLIPNHWRALGPLVRGKKYIVFLREVFDGTQRFEVMVDGTLAFNRKTARSIRSAAERMPGWSEAQRGLATLLVPEKFKVKTGEHLDLWVGYKNVTGRDVVLTYRDWPLDSHTYWELWVESESEGTITPISHPHLSRSDIVDYFSANAHHFDMTLEPGETYFFPLIRVNSAEQGWGYKERLDFKYYPMKAPGRYSIIALGHHVRRDTLTRAEPLQVWVK